MTEVMNMVSEIKHLNRLVLQIRLKRHQKYMTIEFSQAHSYIIYRALKEVFG